MGFAERVLPRAAELWVQASLEQRQRLQQLLFREGIAFDGNQLCSNRSNRSCFQLVTAGKTPPKQGLVAQIFPRWNPLTSWMRQIEDFQRAA